MKVLLLSAPTVLPDFDFIATVPNLGLVSIAGNIGDLCTVRIADTQVLKGNANAYVRDAIAREKPDLVGISCMTFQYSDALEFARNAKEQDIPVVMGGYHPTLMCRELSGSPDARFFDFIIRGEGELAFRQLVAAFDKGDFASIAGLSYRDGEKFVHNPASGLLDLDALRLPDRGARLIETGFNAFGRRLDAVETSRGCVQGCKFCSINHMYGRSFRTFSIERVIADIREVKKRGTKSVLFVDDNVTLDPARLERLCEAIIANGLDDLHYHTQASAKGMASERLVGKMAEAGFKFVFLGIESGIKRNLEFFNKGRMSDNTEAAVRYLHDNDILVAGGLISGAPDDSAEDVWNNFHLAKKLGIDVPIFYILTPYPKTALRDELLDGGYVANAGDFRKYDGLTSNVNTKHLSAEELQFESWKMAARFYDAHWMKTTKIKKWYPWWFAKKTLSLYAKYSKRRVQRLLGLRRVRDFFEEDKLGRTYNMGVH